MPLLFFLLNQRAMNSYLPYVTSACNSLVQSNEDLKAPFSSFNQAAYLAHLIGSTSPDPTRRQIMQDDTSADS